MLHVDDSNIFDWQIAIFGPPGTAYAGGYFKAHIRFPGDYPFSAPSFRFLTKIWHPNIYENGEVCISILHPPIDDPQVGFRVTRSISNFFEFLNQGWRITGRTMEPNPIGADGVDFDYFNVERAKHLLTGQCGRVGRLSQLERGQGQQVQGGHLETGFG